MHVGIDSPERFTTLPDEVTLEKTAAAMEARGFATLIVDNLDAAREAVLARIPRGSSVITNPSVTLEKTGIANAINDGDAYGSVREKFAKLDRKTQLRAIKTLYTLSDFALGSVHAVTYDGTLVIASALGSQLASYAWGAANVIFVIGAQKVVPDLQTAHARIYQHCLALENVHALKAYGQKSHVGKILEIHQEDPGRIHGVLIRQAVGF
jgi:hypothetical protein